MKFHTSFTSKLIQHCQNYGGYANETKLVNFFDSIRVTPYARTNTDVRDSMVLVEYQQYINENLQRNIPINNIVPMKLHVTVRSKLMEIYKTYSGHVHETKFRKALSELDFTPYPSNTTGEIYIVLMSDYMKTLRNQPTG